MAAHRRRAGAETRAHARPERSRRPPCPRPAWAAFTAGEGQSPELAIVTLPGPNTTAIRIRWLPAGAQHPNARNEITFDPATAAILAVKRYDDKAFGRKVADSMLEVHRGRFFGDPVAFLFFLAALGLPLFAATGLTLYVLRRRAGRQRRAAPRMTGTAVRQFFALLGSSAGSR